MNEHIRIWNSIISALNPKDNEEFMRLLPIALKTYWDIAVEEGENTVMGELMDKEMKEATAEYEAKLEAQLDEDRKARKYVRE